MMDLKSKISAIRSHLGEAAVATFCDLESSIKTDTGKTSVPGGAVHPLTRYIMNYVKYACEYKNTLEQVFKDYQRTERPSSYNNNHDDELPGSTSNNDNQSNDSIVDDPKPFAAQLMVVMELLHSNLEAKSKLYKDQALCNIFLMNNGRYVMKKIKGERRSRSCSAMHGAREVIGVEAVPQELPTRDVVEGARVFEG